MFFIIFVHRCNVQENMSMNRIANTFKKQILENV